MGSFSMIGTGPFDRFISANRWCVVTSLRRDGTPASSLNAYARDGDQLLISTQAHRLKAKSLAHDPRITVCVINDAAPFSYVSVEGSCEVQREDILEATRTVLSGLAGSGYTEPADLPGWIAEQGRVILRVTPTRVSGVIR
jgi:PPOX class probable F420-dependent enzyme